MVTEEQRARTLARFAAHREAWARNPALRSLYGDWYARIRRHLPAAARGPFVEIGSGPWFAREVLPELRLSDLVQAPWHDYQLDAGARLPFADGELGALVLFDVLHHLASPRRFFAEAARVLRARGRVVLCEPLISPLSYPVYKFLHEEPVDMGVDPLTAEIHQSGATEKDPFDSNQAVPTLLFGRHRAAFERAFPSLRVVSVERLAGPSYAASGGFSRGALLPMPLWRTLHSLEQRLPSSVFRLIGFRLLAVIERM